MLSRPFNILNKFISYLFQIKKIIKTCAYSFADSIPLTEPLFCVRQMVRNKVFPEGFWLLTHSLF